MKKEIWENWGHWDRLPGEKLSVRMDANPAGPDEGIATDEGTVETCTLLKRSLFCGEPLIWLEPTGGRRELLGEVKLVILQMSPQGRLP